MEKNKNAKAFARTPMPIELRAKQFMPFATVTGLEAALREKNGRESKAATGTGLRRKSQRCRM